MLFLDQVSRNVRGCKERLAAHLLENYLLEMDLHNTPDAGALMRIYASLVWPYMELGLHDKASDVAQKALRRN